MQAQEIFDQLLSLLAKVGEKGDVKVRAAFHAVMYTRTDKSLSCAACGKGLSLDDASYLALLTTRHAVQAMRLIGRDEDRVRAWIRGLSQTALAPADENESGWMTAREEEPDEDPEKNDDGDQFRDPGRRW